MKVISRNQAQAGLWPGLKTKYAYIRNNTNKSTSNFSYYLLSVAFLLQHIYVATVI